MFQSLENFINSQFFNAFVTLVVGSFAYGVYRKGKRDEKRRAASVVLLEIEEAEQHLSKVSVSTPFPSAEADQVKLMPVSSWGIYKHLFINDFDRNETDKISDFYMRCEDYDHAATLKTNITFEQTQQELRTNMQRVLADYAKDYNDNLEAAQSDERKSELEKAYIERRKRFVDIYGNTSETHMYTYIPIKPYNDAQNALQGLEPSLSLTSVGTKLKSISRSRSLIGIIIDKLRGRNT
ncbi:MAG TPA: hypothetical protein VFH06_02315 [Candidatus Saccharimonadales bacterium]|nr:hypothetical protein [Candidatus Saccharimonadales bacterium]